MTGTDARRLHGQAGLTPAGWPAQIRSAYALARIEWGYRKKAGEISDIQQHLPFLRELSRSCANICEMGVRGCVSSWAFLSGLAESPRPEKELLCVDLVAADISSLQKWGGMLLSPIRVTMEVADSKKIVLPRDYDLLFIDTLHVYGQLQAELRAHHKRARRYICLHDTEVDRDQGEVLRMGWDAGRMARETGLREQDLCRGLGPAISEFLAEFPEWVLLRHFPNNNGLTVLARKAA